MVKKTALGRGLEALLSTKTALEPPTNQAVLKKIPLSQIQPGRYQPRRHMDQAALEELAASIKSQGLIQPIVVRRLAPDQYELIAGERRWRACQLVNMADIPAIVRDIPDQAAAALALIENIQRENLNTIEEANALKRLIEEFGLTHQQTADAVGRSRAAITNLLRLLDLPAELKAMVERNELSSGHARALLSLKDEAQQLKLAERIIAQQLSVRTTEELVKLALLGKIAKVALPPPQIDADMRVLQDSLSERLGARVSISHSKRGKGKVVIEYHSLDELEGILSHLQS
ncbi:ParB/RepB/Spo0J family partition protein [Thiofilum flexile]|uniref:ParB/RepB/Spo0J family partition protein n=1 Tax=Thiofilum flexile TaxID=125627 RepID=UPI0003635643|nr:ParB/RepB/Spo0J family partition protein [Thiofilum flexile]